MGRKILVGAVMVMAVAAMSAQPAEAGVGGCGPGGLFGVGGCKLGSKISIDNGSVLLDSLKGAVRADILAYLKSLAEAGKVSKGPIQGATPTSDGVGGCGPGGLFGVGGCKL